MADALDELFTEEDFRPPAKSAVIKRLQGIPVPNYMKRRLLVRWAKRAGATLAEGDINVFRGGPLGR